MPSLSADTHTQRVLDLAHQPDEWVGIEDLKNSIAVLAIATAKLLNH